MESPRLTQRQAFWFSHYKRCINDKLTFQAYCSKHNLSAPAFGHARKTLIKLGAITSPRDNKKSKNVGFVSVKRTEASPIASRLATIVFPNHVRLEVPAGLLAKLLPTLLGSQLPGGEHD
jgi:hypothetical protein